MAAIKINRDTLNKLTHESVEIRHRTMEQLSSKLNRALALNENIEFKPGDLCKQLIRWFGFVPVQKGEKALTLLKSILESPKYGIKAIEKLGAERIVKELRKIQSLYDRHSVEYKIVSKLKEFLKHHTVSCEKNGKETEGEEDLIQCVKSMKISEVDLGEYNSKDYEISWSRPSSADYTSMKFLSDILINKFASAVEIENAIQHLQITMDDYPVEYFLQAPHIFRNLLQIYDYRKNTEKLDVSMDMVVAALMQFLVILEKQLKILKKSASFPHPYRNKNGVEKCSSLSPWQLEFGKALNELFDATVFHLESYSTYGNVTPIIWEMIFKLLQTIQQVDGNIEKSYLYKIASVISNLGVKFAETEHCARLRLHQMLLIFLLQDIAQVNKPSELLKTVVVYEPILRDYTIKCFFKARYKHLEGHVLKVDKSLNEKYNLLKNYEESFEMAIQMLTNSSKLSCGDVIKKGHSVCVVLDLLQSKQLIDVLFAATIQAIPLYKGNVKLKEKALHIILKMLNLTNMPLKVYIYEKLSAAFKKHIGCLMTGERYIIEFSNNELLESHIIGVPLNTKLLQQIVHESFESGCDKIQKNCYKILELLLQSQTLFGTSWGTLLPFLLPVLPLLNCCTLSEKLMNLLLKLYDPDLNQLPYVNVLQGNLGFLFHENGERRSEALTRLIYTLNSLKDSQKYVPNLLEISDTLPNDICLQNTPREYRNIFSDRLPIRTDVVNSLYNLLHLLDSSDVEPLIRKTTLMQINVLCNNWQVTGELCNLAAYYLILQALENALLQSSGLDYPDAAVPAISILNKLMLYDTSFRCELAETPNIYVLLLRALMMFHHDIQVRQDATMCLFQLIFSTQLITTENSMEGPLILANIQMPLDINLNSILSNRIHQESEKLSSIFASALEECQYWRMFVASTYFDGLENITQKSISLISQLDICDNLKLTSQDIRFIRATQPLVALQRLLKAASNATDHRSLIQACILLKQQLLMLNLANTYTVSDDFCLQLNDILKKYLQMPPGNNADLELYEHLLDVTKMCITIPLLPVSLEIFKILLKDSHHALITLLSQREEIPVRIFNKITVLLKYLICEHNNLFQNHYNPSECSTFYSNLFDLFVERCLQLFEIRDLQRVRCILCLLVAISSCQLDMPDQLIFFYCRRFVQLSLALKSFTQTGAQWHRHCLLTILQLSDQMQNSSENFRLNAGFVKYLSGLCGHNDVEVRTLAWSVINVTAKTLPIENSEGERKCSNISGRELLLNELSYLPGGFMACCLSTLLDVEEAISVRNLAGQLMVILIQSHEQVEEIEKLIEKYNFVRIATESFTSSVCVLENEVPKNLDTCSINLTTCDLISCYSLICIELSLRISAFLDELCTKSFMFKLFEILKQPTSTSPYSGYLNMIGHICRLYTMCYSNNFSFLQRTICRDPVWLNSFCQILFGVVSLSEEMYIINNMLQLLLVLCKDSTALEQLSIKLMDYSNDIVKLFLNSLAIKNLNTGLQSYTLSILSFLLIKSQPTQDNDQSIRNHILDLFEKKNVLVESTVFKDKFDTDNKENEKRNVDGTGKKSMNKKQKNISEKEQHLDDENETNKSSISEHMSIALIRLFTHLYPIKACKFSTPPNGNQHHVTETLAIILKQSTVAQETAQNLKLQEKIVKIFKNFLDEFSTTSCTTFVKRNGEHKKLAVIKNLQLLLKLLISWYSSPSMLITDNGLAMDYSKILIQIWPWLAHSSDLKLSVLQCCAFLSERSLVVCKQFSTLNNGSFPHSVLQLIAKMMTAETLKLRANSSDCSQFIRAGLRVLINCCSCVEGRNTLNKIHILDIFDSLYPFNCKAPQLKMDIAIGWLEFWELFSRYDEGAQSRHLNALCYVINKSSSGCAKRLLSLRILRNMAFLNSNRSILITSDDFTFTLNQIVTQPIKDSVEEQLIMCVALWKLISGGIKFVAMIRGTKLAKNLRLLKENLTCTEDDKENIVKHSNDLLNILNIIFKIFNN